MTPDTKLAPIVNVFELKSYYMVTDVVEHEENKSKLLKQIYDMPDSSMQGVSSKTDWNLPKDIEREYVVTFREMMRPYLQKIADRLICGAWDVHNIWYQVYKEGDSHPWHNHPQANYTNVYYLSLPNSSMKTQLFDAMDKEEVKNIDVKEGQLLTFPASYIHRSPPYKPDKPKYFWSKVEDKVIISFNSSFTGVFADVINV